MKQLVVNSYLHIHPYRWSAPIINDLKCLNFQMQGTWAVILGAERVHITDCAKSQQSWLTIAKHYWHLAGDNWFKQPKGYPRCAHWTNYTLHFPSAIFISMFLRILVLFVASKIPTWPPSCIQDSISSIANAATWKGMRTNLTLKKRNGCFMKRHSWCYLCFSNRSCFRMYATLGTYS